MRTRPVRSSPHRPSTSRTRASQKWSRPLELRGFLSEQSAPYRVNVLRACRSRAPNTDAEPDRGIRKCPLLAAKRLRSFYSNVFSISPTITIAKNGRPPARMRTGSICIRTSGIFSLAYRRSRVPRYVSCSTLERPRSNQRLRMIIRPECPCIRRKSILFNHCRNVPRSLSFSSTATNATSEGAEVGS